MNGDIYTISIKYTFTFYAYITGNFRNYNFIDYLKPKYSGFDFFLYDTTICTTSDEMEFIR